MNQMERHGHADMIRLRSGQALVGTVVDDPDIVEMHYVGRSLPCSRDCCPACDAHVPSRVYGYLPFVGSSGRIIIVELTAEALHCYRELGAGRGWHLRIYRESTSGRSTCRVRRESDAIVEPSVVPPDVDLVLSKIWDLPPFYGSPDWAAAANARLRQELTHYLDQA